MVTAQWAPAKGIHRAVIRYILSILDINDPFPGKKMAMSGIAAWHHTVKKIYTPVYRFQDIHRCTNTH